MLEVPNDATPEIKKSLRTHYTQMRYFKIDKIFKSMKLLGAMDLPEETTDSNALSWSEHPLHEEGGWKWHVYDGLDIQFKMNSDNTVMRMCNFKDKKVRETGDPTANMSYFLAKSRAGDRDGGGGSKVAPGFDPPPIDRTVKKHKELNVIMGQHVSNKFRSTVGDSGPIEIKYKANFKEVLKVDTENEMFGAVVEVYQEWAITRPDAADYVASSRREDWFPKSFMPPVLTVYNEAKDPTHLVVKPLAFRCRLHVRPEDNMVVVKRKLTFEGDFWEPFELESYPFDVQPLKVILRSENMKQSICEFVYMPKDEDEKYKPPRDTEWWTSSTASGSNFIPETEEEDDVGGGASQDEWSSDEEEDNVSLLSEAMEENDRLLKLDPMKPNSSLFGADHQKMTEPPLTPFPGSAANLIVPGVPGRMSTEMRALEANADAAATEEARKVGFLDVAGTVGAKVKRRRAKRKPMMGTRSASLFDPLGAVELILEAVVQRYYRVHLIRVVLVMALFSLTSLFSLSMDPEVHCLDRFALLVTLLLTASTYQITIAAELPALGYLTFIDYYVLITFFFIFIVILQVGITELVPAANDMTCDYNFTAERCDSTEYRMTIYKWFMLGDLILWAVMHFVIAYWIVVVIIPYEQNKSDIENRGLENRSIINSDKPKRRTIFGGENKAKQSGFGGGEKRRQGKMSPVFESAAGEEYASDTSEQSLEFLAGQSLSP